MKKSAVIVSIVIGAMCCLASGQGGTSIDDLVAKTKWVKDTLKSARAKFAETTIEHNLGKIVNYELVIDWAVSNGKTYRKELSRLIDKQKSKSFNTTIFDGENTISIYETEQPRTKAMDRQVEKRVGQQHFADIFSGTFEIHDQLLPDALASGKYSIVKEDANGIELDGVYQANQRIKFVLSPENGYLVKRAEIYGDDHFSQIQTVEKFGGKAGAFYPESGTCTVAFENSKVPTTEAKIAVKSFEVGKVPDDLFVPNLKDSVVTDTVAHQVYAMTENGKQFLGRTVSHDATKAPRTSKPYGIVLLAGFSVLCVGIGLRVRSKLSHR